MPLGFTPCESHPCLMYRVNENGLWFILMHVDNNLIIGSNMAIEQVTDEIKKTFSVTICTEVTEYLGCEIHIAKDHSCRMDWTTTPIQKLGANIQKHH